MSPEALKAAREMAAEAWKKRLQRDRHVARARRNLYESLLGAVSREVQQTRVLLESREARRARSASG